MKPIWALSVMWYCEINDWVIMLLYSGTFAKQSVVMNFHQTHCLKYY